MASRCSGLSFARGASLGARPTHRWNDQLAAAQKLTRPHAKGVGNADQRGQRNLGGALLQALEVAEVYPDQLSQFGLSQIAALSAEPDVGGDVLKHILKGHHRHTCGVARRAGRENGKRLP